MKLNFLFLILFFSTLGTSLSYADGLSKEEREMLSPDEQRAYDTFEAISEKIKIESPDYSAIEKELKVSGVDFSKEAAKPYGASLLLEAIKAEDAKLVKLLLDFKADASAADALEGLVPANRAHKLGNKTIICLITPTEEGCEGTAESAG